MSDTGVSAVPTVHSVAHNNRRQNGQKQNQRRRCHKQRYFGDCVCEEPDEEDTSFLHGANRQVLRPLGNYAHSQVHLSLLYLYCFNANCFTVLQLRPL